MQKSDRRKREEVNVVKKIIDLCRMNTDDIWLIEKSVYSGSDQPI